MATYSEQMQDIFKRYEAAGMPIPAEPRAVAAWAIKNGLWRPKPADVHKLFADDLTRALREEYRTDDRGRRYRAKHAVRSTKDGKQISLWADKESAPHNHMKKAFVQRRKQIVGDCYQLQTDVDVYIETRAQHDPVQVLFDFTDDVAEIQALELRERAS